MENQIINKVSESGIVSIDPAQYVCTEPIEQFDLADFLFMKLILKEKEFRESLRVMDWSIYSQKNVAVLCTADAIIPAWAYMLVTTYLAPIAKRIICGSMNEMKRTIEIESIQKIDTTEFLDSRMVIKGCGDISIPDYIYAELTRVLLPAAKSIMYGEPCSTVPVYKRKA